MGGFSPAALRRAGRFGASLLQAFAGPDESAQRRRMWEESMRPGLAQPPKLGVIRDVWADNDAGRTEWIRQRMREMWRFYAKFGDGVPGDAVATGVEANIDAMMGFTILGTPEQVYEELAPLLASGIDELVLRVRFDGIDAEHVDRCVELMAAEVLPRLRELA
jgi:alkanesulfonate monooxygenase SsuD/methylene tetrahydromethanopterin reductase-like flavin-dependent oxidoreductase (luciferase family)